jgi:hypothetical protein
MPDRVWEVGDAVRIKLGPWNGYTGRVTLLDTDAGGLILEIRLDRAPPDGRRVRVRPRWCEGIS